MAHHFAAWRTRTCGTTPIRISEISGLPVRVITVEFTQIPGVQNKWFYLLTVGEAGVNDNGDAYDVTGIGMVDAAAILTAI